MVVLITQHPAAMTNKIFSYLTVLGTGFLLVSCFAPEKTYTRDFEETFSGIKEIEIDGRFLEISYEGREGDEDVFLNAYLELPESSDLDIKYRKSGSKLKIEVVGEASYSGWNFGKKQLNGFISITGPDHIKLNFVCNSGSIDVMNVNHKNIHLQANSGSIKASEIEVDHIYLKASSGGIKGEGLYGKINCEVNSGAVSLKDVEGDVEAKGSSGALKFENVEGRVDAKVNSGAIKLIKVQELGELNASSGSIKATGSGLGKHTSLTANSGSINIQTNSVLDEFNYDLTASSGSIKVGDRSSGKKLVIDNQSNHTVKGKVTSGSLKISN
jgi:lia operon protein LiaG